MAELTVDLLLPIPGHTSAEVATWTAPQAIAYMAAQIRENYRPDIAAKCTDACAAVAELIAERADVLRTLSEDDPRPDMDLRSLASFVMGAWRDCERERDELRAALAHVGSAK